MTRYTPIWLQAGSYAASVDRRLLGAIWPVGGVSGCAVTVSSAMTLNIAAGQVAVPTQNNTGSTLCSSDATEQVTLAAAPGSGTNRYDLVICQPRGNDLDGGANNDFIFTTVTGTAAATPTVPAVPAGALAIAQVYVPGGSASVTPTNITDRRGSLGVNPNQMRVHAYRNGAMNVATGSGQLISLDAVEFDPLGMLQGGEIQVPVPGTYMLAISVGVASGATGTNFTLQAVAQKNDSVWILTGCTVPVTLTGFNIFSSGSRLVALAAGDRISLRYMWGAGAFAVQTGTQNTFLSLYQIG
jgi:hypothetical protein